MKIYQMPGDLFDILCVVNDPNDVISNIEPIFEELYGIHDVYRTDGVPYVEDHFPYEIIDEEKFATFILKFG